jgi:hypothetical protein
MHFRRHETRHRAQAGGVHLASSASLSSFSSVTSNLPAAPLSDSSHSDIAARPSLFTAPQCQLPPDTILPVPRSSSLLPAMGQAQSRSPPELVAPPPSPTVPTSSGSAESKLKRVFGGGRKKKSEDISVNPATLPLGMGKSHSLMTTAPSQASSSSAPMLPHHPSVSAGPGYPTSPFTRHVPAERPSIPPSKPLPGSPMSVPINNPPLPSDQRSSILPATPAITAAAIQYISETENAGDFANIMRRPKKRDSDYEAMKEDWRKSDSTTTSYYTVRPRSGTSGGTRTPRPVSMAESLHSTNTIVPASRRLSALVTEAEFIMTEEAMSRSTSLTRKTSPSGSSKTLKGHSISLSFTSPLSSNQPATATPSSESRPSRPAFNHRPSGDGATLSKAAASGIIGPLHDSDSRSVGSHIKGNLVALSAATSATHSLPRQQSSSPSQHGSVQQTAITVTSGLAPAAGFAIRFGRRAVERMGRALGSLGSSHNTSGHSSSSSLSAGTDFGRNESSISLASHVSQAQTGKSKQRRTPNAPSGAWSVNTQSSTSTGQTDPEPFGFTSPALGTCLRGPMQNNAGTFVIGGLVFGRDLKVCVHDTAIDAIRLASPSSGDSQSGEIQSVSVSHEYSFMMLCSLTHPSRASAARTCSSLRGTPDEMGCRGRRSFPVRQFFDQNSFVPKHVEQNQRACDSRCQVTV